MRSRLGLRHRHPHDRHGVRELARGQRAREPKVSARRDVDGGCSLDAIAIVGRYPSMIEPVRPARAAIVAGLLVALYVVITFLIRPIPDAAVSLLGGPGGVDRIGGLRVRYRPAPGSEAAFEQYLAQRADVRRDRDMLVLEFPGLSEDLSTEIIETLAGGGLAMKEVLETDYAVGIGETDEVFLDVDSWHTEDDGPAHTNPFLKAYTRAALDKAIANATARGWSLPAHHELGFEFVEPDLRDQDQRPYWRTYELASEVLIDGSMISGATQSFEPSSNRPVVLLDLTRRGGERFCDVTARLVTRKLATILGGRIRSAPIINDRICGGRVSITMGGGSDPEREARALVAVLAQGALPPGGKVEAHTWTPPADVRNQEWAARLLLGLGAGLAFALLVGFVLRLARPVWRAKPAPVVGVFPWRRLAVTLLAPVVLVIGGKLVLPGLNGDELEHVMGRDLGSSFSVVALGVGPIFVAFFLVELVALIVPRLRWRRHDALGRVALGQGVAVLAIVFALIQGYFMARYLESLGDGLLGFGRHTTIVERTGWQFRLLVMGSLASGTLVLAVVAGMIREHGLGNGYGVVIVTSTLLGLVQPYVAEPGAWPDLLTRGHLLGFVTLTAIVIATANVLRWRVATGERESALRMPVTGVAPLRDTAALVFLVMMLSALKFGDSFDDAAVWISGLQRDPWLAFGIVLVSIPIWAWLFSRPSLVERVAMQAGLDRPTRAAWRRATLVSALLLGSVMVLWLVATRTDVSVGFAEPVGAMIGAAVVLDMIADARAHRRRLVPVGVLHQIQYAGVIERVLGDAGIPCHLHASHLRTLLAFFGPFAPAIIMVPEQFGETARITVGDVLRSARTTVPVARANDLP